MQDARRALRLLWPSLVVWLAVAAAAGPGAAASSVPPSAAPVQADDLEVRLVTPDADTFVTGPTVLRAEVTPAGDTPVVRVDFYVDDQLVGSREEPPWEVTWDAGEGFARHVVRVEAVDTTGRQAEDVVVTRDLETAVFRAEVEAVLLYVTVVDNAGRYVSGLERDDFEVYEDGERQEVTFFANEPRPMVVGLLIDTSGSMEGPKLLRARQGALAFLEQLGEDDEALVMSFDNFPKLLQELTPSHRLLRDAIESLQLGGATSLNLAIVQGVDNLAERPERKALIVLSDGFDTVQSVSEQQAIDYARRSDVRLYTLGIFGSGRSGVRRGGGFDAINPGETALRAFADGTGGQSFFLRTLGELEDAYVQIAAELRSQYALAYRPSEPAAPGEWREVEVRVDGGEARTKPGYVGGER